MFFLFGAPLNLHYLCRLDKCKRCHDNKQYYQICVHSALVAGIMLAATDKGC